MLNPRFLLALLPCVAFSQPAAAIIDIAQDPQNLSRVAPGQIVSLLLRGLTTRFDSTQVATSLPLPRDFGGVSVTLRQSGSSEAVQLPLIRGEFFDNCTELIAVPGQRSPVPCSDTDSGMFRIQVQIPYELKANPPGPIAKLVGTDVQDAILTVYEKGTAARSIRVIPVVDQIRVLRQCDDTAGMFGELHCVPLIYHADGTQVTSEKPARAGEQVVAYAYGLGVPAGTVASGGATPDRGLSIGRSISVVFTGVPSGTTTARYAGLVGNEVGLYQINFQIPALPEGLLPCDEMLPFNLTAIIRGAASSDQVSFCTTP
jgi:uncharacterized protein (TIGR03437 family)